MDNLEIIENANSLGQALWDEITGWNFFHMDTIGKQMARSADSISANLCESRGRYYYNDRKRFIYYSRGSLYETRNWVEKSVRRGLIQEDKGKEYLSQLATLLLQINTLLKYSK